MANIISPHILYHGNVDIIRKHFEFIDGTASLLAEIYRIFVLKQFFQENCFYKTTVITLSSIGCSFLPTLLFKLVWRIIYCEKQKYSSTEGYREHCGPHMQATSKFQRKQKQKDSYT